MRTRVRFFKNFKSPNSRSLKNHRNGTQRWPKRFEVVLRLSGDSCTQFGVLPKMPVCKGFARLKFLLRFPLGTSKIAKMVPSAGPNDLRLS